MPRTWAVGLLGGCAIVALPGQPGRTQQAAPQPGAEWPMYRRDYAGSGYSPLAQITTKNVSSLREVWSYRLQDDANSQATPIVVNDVMYLPAGDRVVALDPITGAERWRHVMPDAVLSRRGVAYWSGVGAASRIIFMGGRRLMALDAATGDSASEFGKNGEVDVVVPYNSVPLVYRNVVVVGANNPPRSGGAPGNARAFDARTGAKLWEFTSVAQPGSVGHETWAGDSWKGRFGANAWPFYFTLDEERGLVYLPLASPIPGGYGGDRPGANLYGNSVVAVDVRTGAHKWHFQTIHHDLWDADPPAPPGLLDIVRNGRRVPAMAVTTKSGYMYILNRETGQPIFEVEERPVPKSDVPGEQTFPTQPIPVKPSPLARTAYRPQDLVSAADTTPEHAAACRDLIEKSGGVYNAGPFTPWKHRDPGAAGPVSLVFPGGLGGPNWGGTASDPASGYVFVATQDVGALGFVRKAREGAAVPYEKATPGRATFDVPMGNESWPCQRPPWGTLVAVNASTGDFAWRVPLGITEQLPAGRQNTGRPVLAGPIATGGGLLFVASTDDYRFRGLIREPAGSSG
ncbi:MAG: PQQ-binding-like beta-propeller repeat protein, partial [Vicinamibacterales bacterium]